MTLNGIRAGIICGAAMLMAAPAHSQCQDGTTVVWAYTYITRETGNSVYSYAEESVTGNYRLYWQLYMSTWLYVNNTLDLQYLNDTKTPPGSTVWRSYRQIPQDKGPGTYRLDSSYRAYASACNQWSPPYTNGWSGNESRSLIVERPTVSMDHPIWWLGGYGGFGNYQVTSVISADPKGAPTTPSWTVSGQPQKVSFTCNACSQAYITSQQPSNGQNDSKHGSCTYDVLVRASVDGFMSDPFFIYIAMPHHFTKVATNYSSTLGPPIWVWNRQITYELFDACNNPLLDMEGGEKFPQGWSNDVPNNWKVCKRWPSVD